MIVSKTKYVNIDVNKYFITEEGQYWQNRISEIGLLLFSLGFVEGGTVKYCN